MVIGYRAVQAGASVEAIVRIGLFRPLWLTEPVAHLCPLSLHQGIMFGIRDKLQGTQAGSAVVEGMWNR